MEDAQATTDGLFQRLQASEIRFRELIERNADGMLVVDIDGKILFANPAACQLMGRISDQLIGTEFGIPLVPGDTIEIDIPRRNADVCVAELRVVSTDWNGESAIIASIRDVSSRKALEKELEAKVKKLADSERRKNEFLAMLGHELRNPLAPIGNAVEVLKLSSNNSEITLRMIRLIDDQVKTIRTLVNDLLDVARIENGKVSLRKQRIDLNQVIARAAWTVTTLIQSKSHRLVWNQTDSPVWIEGDPIRLEQVFVNLLSNAAKYTEPNGTIRISVKLGTDTFTVIVEDNGIGIPPEFLDAIFDLFSQGERPLARTEGGLGVGLSVVRSLVERHGGLVRVASAGSGRGSRFEVDLPFDVDWQAMEIANEWSSEMSQTEPACRILLVDDNEPAVESLSMLLKIWGYETLIAYDGQQALQLANEFNPDAFLLDIGLPIVDGYEVVRQLRANPRFADSLILAMTGYGNEEDYARSISAGFSDHLVKPLELSELERKLDGLRYAVKLGSSA